MYGCSGALFIERKEIMKRYIKSKEEHIFGMANITPRRSGVPADLWSDHGGISRQVSHNHTPRVKVAYQDNEISISIEAQPKILAPKGKKIPGSAMKYLQTGIDYVGRNYDLFLKHYMDTDDSFDDQDLFEALRERKEFK